MLNWLCSTYTVNTLRMFEWSTCINCSTCIKHADNIIGLNDFQWNCGETIQLEQFTEYLTAFLHRWPCLFKAFLVLLWMIFQPKPIIAKLHKQCWQMTCLISHIIQQHLYSCSIEHTDSYIHVPHTTNTHPACDHSKKIVKIITLVSVTTDR